MPQAIPESVDALLQRMVQINSVNVRANGPGEAELAQDLEALAQRWGLRVRRLNVPDEPDNLLITVEVSSDRPWLLFDSHMDTVAVEGMTIDPFGGVVEEGRLYGRGACDTKCTGAAMLWALKEYAACSDQPNNIALLFSVNEELGMTGIQAFLTDDYPQLGFVPRGVIVGEPTMLRPLTAHNGAMRLTVATVGVAAHSAAPYLGRNAIHMMGRLITAFEQQYLPSLEASSHPLTGGAVASITLIQGGNQINIVPQRCTIDIDRRLSPGETVETASAAFERFLAQLSEGDAHFEARIEQVRGTQGLNDEDNQPLLSVVQSALKAHDLPCAPMGAPFTTHAGRFAQAGLMSLVLGPGDPMPAHTKNEWVELAQVRLGTDVYRAIMQQPIAHLPAAPSA